MTSQRHVFNNDSISRIKCKTAEHFLFWWSKAKEEISHSKWVNLTICVCGDLLCHWVHNVCVHIHFVNVSEFVALQQHSYFKLICIMTDHLHQQCLSFQFSGRKLFWAYHTIFCNNTRTCRGWKFKLSVFRLFQVFGGSERANLCQGTLSLSR